jgi:hypothetical protein
MSLTVEPERLKRPVDLLAYNAFGRSIVLPSVANRDTLGVRPIADPREAQIPASPMAAKNSADLRQANGPRQSSSSSDAREKDAETSDVRARGRAPARQHAQEGDDRGTSVDVTV